MNVVLSFLLLAAFAGIHVLAGGRSLALSLPSYGLLGFAAILGWWQMRRINIPHRAIPCIIASGIFIGYVVARAIFSPEEYLARRDLYLALAAFTVYLLIALNLTSSELRVRLVIVLLILAAAHVAVGAIQFAKGDNYAVFPFLPRPEYGSRASGFFGYPNHFAAYLEIALLFGLGVTCWSRCRPWVKLTAAYFVAVCIAGVLLSGSRGGLVSTLAGLVVFGAMSLLVVSHRMRWHSTVAIAGGVFIAVMLAFSVQWAMRENLARRTDLPLSGDMGGARIMLWKTAIQQFQSYPVFGAGSGLYLYYVREFKPLGIQSDPEYAHNDGLQFLAEYGAVGGISFLAFLGLHLRSGWRAFHNRISREAETLSLGSNSLALTTGAISSVAACMVHACVDFTLHSPAVTLVVAFTFGILGNPSGETRANAPESKGALRLTRSLRLLAPTCGICLLLFSLRTLPAEIHAEQSRQILSDWRYMESAEVAKTAEHFARQGIAYDSDNPELYYCLGEALVAQAAVATNSREKERLYIEASLVYQNALSAAPRDSRLLLCLASTLDALERFAEAEPLYAEAIRRDPISKYAHWAFGHHFELQNKLDEAEASYQNSRRLGGAESATMALDRIAVMRKNQTNEPIPTAQGDGGKKPSK